MRRASRKRGERSTQPEASQTGQRRLDESRDPGDASSLALLQDCFSYSDLAAHVLGLLVLFLYEATSGFGERQHCISRLRWGEIMAILTILILAIREHKGRHLSIGVFFNFTSKV